MKKAEMSMSTIVGAVIAIIILVLIIFLVARSGGDANKATSCPSKGGICTDKTCSKYVYDDNGAVITCSTPGEQCCSISAISG